MAQQKSEDRVLPDGGVMPVQPDGSSAGGQGKALPVDEVASQLRLPIATAEAPQGGSCSRSPDRSGGRAAAGAPKAIVNERMCVPAVMEEVVERLGSALFGGQELVVRAGSLRALAPGWRGLVWP